MLFPLNIAQQISIYFYIDSLQFKFSHFMEIQKFQLHVNNLTVTALGTQNIIK